MSSHVDATSRDSETEPRTGLLTLLVIVAAVAVMAGALDGPFIFDDVPLIYGNDRVHDFSQWREWLRGTLWDTNYDPSDLGHVGRFWRPVVLASYAVDWRWGGGSPLAFHLTNLIVHALNASLLFLVLRGWLKASVPALFGALLFAVHPVQTESVAWIAGRTDSLCVLGLLSAVLGFRYRKEHRALGAVALVTGLIVAFGAKEAAVVFPVLVGIEVWSVDKPPPNWLGLRGLLRQVWPFAGLSIAFFVAHRLFVAANDRDSPDLVVKGLLSFESLGRHMALLLWPDDLALGRGAITLVNGVPSPQAGYVALGAITLIGVVVGIGRSRHAHPIVTLGLLATGALLAPVMAVVWIGYDVIASARFLYVPMLAVAFFVSALMQGRLGKLHGVRAAFLMATIALGARSFARATDFSDEEVFWARELASNERYVPAQQALITRELRAHRPESALRLAHRWFSDPAVSVMGKVALVRNAVAAAMELTRDVETESIAVLQRFSIALAKREAAELQLPRLGVHLSVPPNSALLRVIGIDRRQFLLFSANAASRNGDDAVAVRDVDAALEGCEDCWTILAPSALIVARAGQLERAEALLEHVRRVGPPDGSADSPQASLRQAKQWRTNATADPLLREVAFFSALGAFGRAYRLVQPVIYTVAANPATIPKLAELASLAGDMGTAKSLLLRMYPEAEANVRLTELYGQVPWRDRPASTEEGSHGPG